MPLQTTFYASNSGFVTSPNTSTHASVRDVATGDGATDSVNLSTTGISYQRATKGATRYLIRRSFFYFDTSTISTTVTAATLSIYGHTNNSGQVIAIKSTAFGGDGGTALSTGDYDSFPGFIAGGTDSMSGNVTDYSSLYGAWNTSGYNDISLNSNAFTDIQNNNAFIVAVIQHPNDYLDVDPGADIDSSSGVYYDLYTGTSRDPKLVVTYGEDPQPLKITAGLIKLTSGLIKIT